MGSLFLPLPAVGAGKNQWADVSVAVLSQSGYLAYAALNRAFS